MPDSTRIQITFTVDASNVDQAMSKIMKSVDGLVTSPMFEARIVDSLEALGQAVADTRPPRRRRLAACVEQWPECSDDEYNPKCCRFPKSCSCTSYDDETVQEEWLEPPR